MLVRQYVYFSLFSERTSAADMTARLGMEGDACVIRGSRRATPAVPVQHSWQVECRESGLTVDDQVSCVLTRLQPRVDRIAELARRLGDEDPGGGAVLQVVRYFEDADEQPTAQNASAPSSTPNLFGWHLDHDILNFMHVTGAVLDVDEYDLSDR